MPSEPLPIYDIESDIVQSLNRYGRLMLSAPTGSGKSTQVPQIALRHGILGKGEMVVLQPRRLAARLLASRVAQELDVRLGEEVGYQIRLEKVAGPSTRIRFVTEGVLLRQMMHDPNLAGVAAIVFDEFHERHLYGDISLARALDLQESARPDLKILVMSATLAAEPLARYLHPCQSLQSTGRTHPVDIQYARRASWEQKSPVWEQAADAFAAYVQGRGPGDVLVFMPGSFEIHQTLDALRRRAESKGYLLLPLHGELAPREQDAAVARYSQPKIVVATNVAETSITIDGVRLVIDSGLARIPRYDPYRGINTLLIDKISQASAQQRAGRAGRTAPGTCFRLWSAQEHADRPAQEKPEVQRLDLSEVVLTLKAAGIHDLTTFRWLEPPDTQRLRDAESLLHDLGALQSAGPDQHAQVTDLGRRMLAFPLHPRYARMLLAAQELNCVHHAALLAALTQGRDLLLRKIDDRVAQQRERLWPGKTSSDFLLLLRAWQFAAEHRFELDACRSVGIHALAARQVSPLHRQFLDIARRQGLDIAEHPIDETTLRQCLLMGFSDRVARRLDQGTLRCDLVHGRRGVLARESAVHHHPLLAVAEIREVGRHGGELNTILSLATAIEPAWLETFFPQDMGRRHRVFYDPTAKRVLAEEELTFRDLTLQTRPLDKPPESDAARLLAEEVLAGRLTLKEWNHSVEQWIARLNCLARWCPELDLPPISPQDRRDLIEQICLGAASYKDIKDRPVKPAVQSWLSDWQQHLLAQYAPERLELPNGKKPKVTYAEDADPHIALRIQELYELKHAPRIAQDKVPVLLHILAPNMRPVQITRDLAGFWSEHYPRIKSELQRKYPKHEWR